MTTEDINNYETITIGEFEKSSDQRDYSLFWKSNVDGQWIEMPSLSLFKDIIRSGKLEHKIILERPVLRKI